MTSRERISAACACAPVDRPPVWLMRQAGRYLPEYRALKEQHGFLEMVRTPSLAAEVTLQPMRRFAFDAAIIFSDILVVPEALGQPYRFREEGGIAMDHPVNSKVAVHALDAENVAERISYIGEAIRLVRRELGTEKALLGFAGSPWTLAAYMTEGGSPCEFPVCLRMAQGNPALFRELMTKISRAVADNLRMQIEAGADAVQIFDSWAALCPDEFYGEWSLRWIREIISALPAGTPVIVFAKGRSQHVAALRETGARVISLGTDVNLASFRGENPGVATQGNLDPKLLEGEPETVATVTRDLLSAVAGPGHIVNLGHGLTPQARVESVAALVESVVKWKE